MKFKGKFADDPTVARRVVKAKRTTFNCTDSGAVVVFEASVNDQDVRQFTAQVVCFASLNDNRRNGPRSIFGPVVGSEGIRSILGNIDALIGGDISQGID